MLNNYPFLAGTVKSLENHLLKRSDIYKLKDKSLSNSILSLQEAGFGNGGTTLDELIQEELKKGMDILSHDAQNIHDMEIFYLVSDAQNIKMLYKSKLFNIKLDDIHANTLINYEEVKNLIFNNVLSSNKYLNDLVSTINNQLSVDNFNAQELSVFIDKTVISSCLKYSKNISSINEFIKLTIDYTNLLTLIRVFKLNWKVDNLKTLLFNGGYIDQNIYINAFNKGLDSLYESMKNINSYIDKLVLSYINDHDTDKVELLSKQFILDQIKKYSDDAFDIGPIMYYYLEVNAEIFNVKKVIGSSNIELTDLLNY